MRIGFNARILSSENLRGWNRYAVNLIESLTELGVKPVLFSDRPLHESHLARLHRAELRVSPAMPYALWEQLWLPVQLAREKVELFHSPFHFGLPAWSHCPRVLTLHDAIDAKSDRVTQLHRRIAIARAHKILTVSEHSKSEIVRAYSIDPAKITAIHEAADPRFHGHVTPHHAAKPYFFYVGGLDPRKNIPFLLEAFETLGDLGVELWIAGGSSRESIGGIKYLGMIEDGALPSLYAGALAFVYPSKSEGFGLQLCEAMAVGCPVLAAQASSLPEILGEGGELFPLDSSSRLTELLRRVATDPAYRSRLASRAHARSRAFSWNATAKRTLEAFAHV